ncbi:MAG TPA: hypothetical protein VMB48_01075 [Steroidobacteraceae bacterium]|nr:hypothetical protein [Steroidobacteraceae bacterium]
MNGEPRTDAQNVEFAIVSDHAYVVGVRASCWRCRAAIEVVSIYCDSGWILGEEQVGFLVSNVSAVDEPLRRQLLRWPQYRPERSGRDVAYFANHCPGCGCIQRDFFLHCQPGGPFFCLDDVPEGELQVWPLAGTVRLTGDEGFEP